MISCEVKTKEISHASDLLCFSFLSFWSNTYSSKLIIINYFDSHFQSDNLSVGQSKANLEKREL